MIKKTRTCRERFSSFLAVLLKRVILSRKIRSVPSSVERLHGRLFPLRNERAGRGRRPRSAPRRHARFPGSATFSDRELRPFVNGAKTAKTRKLRRERCSLLPRPSVGESDGEMAHAGARSGRGPRRHFGVIAVAGAAGACPRGEQASPLARSQREHRAPGATPLVFSP